MHYTDRFAHELFYLVVHGTFPLDEAIAMANRTVGSRSRFYRLVEAYTRP